ncbi:MAG: queuosine precursor transporter [bacterium]|nr:queuosine precursor transporter [bacterium]
MIFLIQTVTMLLLTLGAFKMGKNYLKAFVGAGIVLANIFVTKQITLFGLDATGGNVMYAAIFFSTDLLSEHYSKKDAQEAIEIGFGTSLLYLVGGQFMLQYLPSSYDTVHAGMQEIFAFAPRIILASLLAYLISQFHDIWAYNLIRSKTGQKRLWLRNNGSTWISQLIDSVIFASVAFLGVFPLSVLLQIIVSTYLLKILVALIDTPFMYLSYRLK